MLPKTLTRSASAFALCLFMTALFASNENPFVNDVMPQLHVDFNGCQSFAGGSNSDYSEFTALQTLNPECSVIEMAYPGHVYRNNSVSNKHSCTVGVNNSVAMCVSGADFCFYDPGNSLSIRFNVLVIPGDGGLGSIENLSFYEMAPENFQFIEGTSGPNNYPTKYALRVLNNGDEIYREIDIPTSRDWNLVTFDFSQLSGFTVDQTSTFNFEILPYCTIGNGATVKAFDIDELIIGGGCNNINGGIVSAIGSTDICSADNTTGVIEFQAQNTLGSNFAWLVTDDNGTIVSIPSSSTIDFRALPNGFYNVYNLAFEAGFQGLNQGNNIDNFTGCFDISNGVSILNSVVEGGRLTDERGFIDFYICSNEFSDNQVTTSLNGAIGFNTTYLLHDENGFIIQVLPNADIDFSTIAEGEYFVSAAAHNGQFFNSMPGLNLTDLRGCFDLSSEFRIVKQIVDGGNINLDGLTALNLCGSTSMSIEPEAMGTLGNNLEWVVSNPQGVILNTFNSLPINISNLIEETIEIRLISFVGRMTGYEVNGNLNDIDGCFDLSNVITIQNDGVSGGLIDIDGETSLNICLSDAVSDSYEVNLSGNTGTINQWVVSDEDGLILEISDSNTFDFSNAGAGVCYIRHLSYSDQITGLAEGNNLNDIEGCFSFSNVITIIRSEVDAGAIMTTDGQTSLQICSGDGDADNFTVELIGSSAPFQSLVVTDADGNVLDIPDDNNFNFEGVESGLCFIYNVATDDNSIFSGTMVNVNDLTGCTVLSNAIQVQRDEVVGGIISSDGVTEVTVFVGDGNADNVPVTLSGNVGDSSTWIITDTSGEILALPASPPFDFEAAPLGSCLIWNISYADGLTGLIVGDNVTGLVGCFNLSNSITVNRMGISGGQIQTPDSMTTVTVCLGDSQVDSVFVDLVNNDGPNFAWVITDTLGEILGLPTSPPFEFDSAGPGVCQIWHLAFDTLQGLELGENVGDLNGSFSFSNNITVSRSTVAGGVVVSDLGMDTITVCSGDGMADLLGLSVSGEEGISSSWIITDENSDILLVSDEAPSDFEGVVSGTCQVYHVGYNPGLVGLSSGSNLDDLDGCFDVSNAITVIRNSVEGGNLTLLDSTESITIIAGDGISDAFDVLLTSEVGDSTAWVITDDQGEILALPSGPPFDLEGAGLGTCLIWHVSYTGGLGSVAVGNNASDITGCFDLSNPITVVRTEINGGTILSEDGLTEEEVCLNSETDGLIDATVTGNTGTNFSWVITDTTGMILAVQDTMPFDFSGAPAGICQIWHISYENNLTGLVVNNNVSDLMGSFDLSNNIEVSRIENEGGSIALPNGDIEISISVGDGIIDSIDVNLMGASSDTTNWVITDTLGNILELPLAPPFTFEDAGGGVCLIWNLSSSFGLTGLSVNNNVSQLAGCFDLSNPITVNRMGLMGGNLTTAAGETSLEICIDTIGDPFDVILTDTLGPNHSWLITDTSGLILALPMAPPFDLNGAGPGVCQLWNITYGPNLMGLAQNNNVSDLTGNFNLSNPVTVFRAETAGGVLTTNTGLTQDTIVVGDNNPDLIGVTLTGSMGENQSYVITDTTGLILELPDQPPFNFEDTPPGTCLIWSLSYGFNIDSLEVGNNVSSLNGCFEFSNPVTIVREGFVLTAGSIMTSDSLTNVTICAGDGNPDPLSILIDGNQGPNFAWVVADTSGLIQGLPPGGGMPTSIDLDIAGGGISEILSISYLNGLQGLVINSDLDDLVGTFEISNPITVTRIPVNGGDLMTTDSLTAVTIMVGDGVIDSIDVILENIEGDTAQWILTDNSTGQILDITSLPPFTFEEAGGGVCNIYNVSSTGGISGLAVGNNLTQLIGCYELSNPVVVTRMGVSGGNLATAAGGTTVDVCYNGMALDSLDVVLTDATGTNNRWIITDDSGEILELPIAPPFDFTNAGAGICNVYNISFEGNLTGLLVGQNISDIAGMYDLSNAIVVTRNEAEGGMLMTIDSLVMDTIEIGDGLQDTFNLVLTGNTGFASMFLVTDASGLISQVTDTTEVILSDQGSGVCSIWNISYADNLTGLAAGNNVSDLQGCFDLSNPITIQKEGLSGGFLTLADGSTEVTVCESDDENEPYEVILVDTSGMNYSWIFTNSNDIMFGFPTAPPFNLEGGPIAKLYHIAYDSLTTPLALGQSISSIDGVFDLSNPILINELNPFAGIIRFDNNMSLENVVVGEGVVDSINVNLTGPVQGDTLIYIITESDGNIVEVGGQPPFTFEDAGAGTCRIYHYAGPFDAPGVVVGSSIDSLEGCFSLSDRISIVRKELNGGDIETTTGLTELSYCVGDGVADTFEISLTDTLGENHSWLIVDTTGLIIEVPLEFNTDFDGAGPGVCLVYNIAFTTGLLGLTQGESLDDLDGCFALSNPITVTRNSVFGGNVSLDTEAIEETVCVNQASELLTFVTNSTADNYVYVLTNEENVIDSILPANTYDFAGSELGVCNVWGISYQGNLTLMVGDTVGTNDLADCFDLSANAVVITKSDCAAAPIINEVLSDGKVEILNVGMDVIDLSTYILCNDGAYDTMGDLVVNCGQLLLAPGQFVTVQTEQAIIDTLDGEMALYKDDTFVSNESIVSYVQWGDTMHLRTNIAIGAGLWEAGQAIDSTALTLNNSLNYDGDGILASDWTAGASSNCAANNFTEDEVDTELSFRMFPNPAGLELSFEVLKMPTESGTMNIYDADGRLVYTSKVNGKEIMNVDLSNYRAGVYYIKATAGNRIKTDKFIVVK